MQISESIFWVKKTKRTISFYCIVTFSIFNWN